MKNKRVYHTWEKWECYPAGFYETGIEGKSDDDAKKEYADFLANRESFESGLKRVISEWPNSCEHYLTNERMNRIAWLGQAAACISIGLPQRYRPGYFLLSEEQRKDADLLALEYLNRWLNTNGWLPVDLEGAGINAQVNLY